MRHNGSDPGGIQISDGIEDESLAIVEGSGGSIFAGIEVIRSLIQEHVFIDLHW